MFSLNSINLIESILQSESIETFSVTSASTNKRHQKIQTDKYAERVANNSSRLNLPSSSFDHALTKCEALKSISTASKTRSLGRLEGFALVWFSMNFKGWEDRISQMKGWGENKQHWKELEHSYNRGYVGYNCYEMIRLGLCKKTSTCFLCGGAVKDKFFGHHPILFTNGINK